MPAQVIVVGGGLSGLSAAHTVIEQGGNVVVIDKVAFFGGNSTKATSGINGALTRTQISKGIKDSVEAFAADTTKSARDLARPDLIKVLTGQSASAVEWLQDKFALDLSLVARLGGHSFPRTHRGKERFPGMTITYALMEKYEELTKAYPNRIRAINKARVTRLLTDNNGSVIGVEYEQGGVKKEEHGPVILATGGYAADFTDSSLIKKHRPEFMELPTTNAEGTTGDGHKMAMAIGAKATHLEKIQVHPTGLVDPADPNSKVKFLAAEALRGVGGILINGNGERFCDELGHRDYVTGEIWKTKGPIRLVLNSQASAQILWHCKHYMGRGLMRLFKHGDDIAKEIGVPASKLKSTFDAYNEVARTKKDPYGKRFFDSVPFKMDDEFYVALMTPVLHYTMGGMDIDDQARIRKSSEESAVEGLFAAGELAGGVHGANRLGGSSLLGCVVYGRVAGRSAAKYLLENLSKQNAGSVSAGSQQLPGGVTVTITIGGNGSPQIGSSSASQASSSAGHAPSTSDSSAAASAPPAPAKTSKKEFAPSEVAKHNKESDCWVIVNGKVIDVTKFLPDHPGGRKSILQFAGKDATEEFNMIHKPDVVEKYYAEGIIGDVVGGSKSKL